MNHELVKKLETKPYLFWDINSKEDLSIESIVERVLSCGDWNDFLVLIDVLGIKQVSDIFNQISNKKRTNLSKKTINYFTLYFNKYVPKYTK